MGNVTVRRCEGASEVWNRRRSRCEFGDCVDRRWTPTPASLGSGVTSSWVAFTFACRLDETGFGAFSKTDAFPRCYARWIRAKDRLAFAWLRHCWNRQLCREPSICLISAYVLYIGAGNHQKPGMSHARPEKKIEPKILGSCKRNEERL